jgi:hypothetical protein
VFPLVCLSYLSLKGDMPSARLIPLCASVAILLLAVVPARADSVSATAILNEGTMVFNNQTTTGSPLVFSRVGSLGSASVAASLGLIQVDIDTASTFTNNAYVNAGGNWHENYTIFDKSGPQGSSGTATFTFQLSGTFSGGNLGVGNKVEYTAATPVGSVTADAYFDKDGGPWGPPPGGQIFTVNVPFTYGQPVEISASLGAFADPGNGTAFGHAHLTLRQTGFTVTGGNYTVASATGAGAGATFAANTAYDGFTLTNNLGHLSTATLLDGDASVNRDASLSFVTPDGKLPSISDIVSLSGTNSDLVVMQLQYDEASVLSQFGSENGLYLAWLNPATGGWENAIDGNSTNASNRLDRAYNPATDFTLGNWGEDPVTNTVWAVIDHNSEFAVASSSPAPEPGSTLLLSLGGFVASLRRRKAGTA